MRSGFHPEPHQRRCLWTPPRAEPLEPVTLVSDSKGSAFGGGPGGNATGRVSGQSPERFSFTRLPGDSAKGNAAQMQMAYPPDRNVLRWDDPSPEPPPARGGGESHSGLRFS